MASKFYDEEDNGLEHDWVGKVWMNPPYSQPHIALFMDKLVASYKSGSITEAIVLTNNATATQWWQVAAVESSCICYPAKRISFINPEGESSSPLQGQTFMYFGGNIDSFVKEFSKYGYIK
jgi:hypothetical protein